MACLCVLLGGPSCAAGAESLIIAGTTYCEPGASGPGWAWTDADHLELSGYAGEAIGADGDLVVTLTGRSSVLETSAIDVDISRCGMEVWGDLTLRGAGTLVATGSQCGIHVSGALVVDGCSLDARADGTGVTDDLVAGVIADSIVVRGGGRVVAVGADPGAVRGAENLAAVDVGLGADARDDGRLAVADAVAGRGVRAYGVYLLDGAPGDGAGVGRLSVDASWLDATGAEGGIACLGGSLTAAQLVTPTGGTFDAGGVVDADGSVAAHVAIEPQGATAPAGETEASDAPGNGGPTAKEPSAGPAFNPAPATNTTTTTTVTKTTATKASKPKAATAASSPLPKTADGNRIAASTLLFLLGIALLAIARRC